MHVRPSQDQEIQIHLSGNPGRCPVFSDSCILLSQLRSLPQAELPAPFIAVTSKEPDRGWHVGH